MVVLRVIGNIFLGLLLFLCLVVLGVGISLNATALSSSFVNGQINKLDVSAIVNEELPKFDQDVLAKYPGAADNIEVVVANHQSQLKQAASAVVSDTYGYVVHGHPLDLVATLRRSVFDPNLAVSIINDLDLRPFVDSVLTDAVPPEVSAIDTQPYVDAINTVVEPWLAQQAVSAVPVVYDYLLNTSPATTTITFQLLDIEEQIRVALRAAILANPPVQDAQLSRSDLGDLFDAGWTLVAPTLPAAEEVNLQDNFGAPGSVATNIHDNVMPALDSAHQAVSIFEAAFWGMAAFTLLLVAGLFLVNWNRKIGSRVVGGILTGYGILMLIGITIGFSVVHGHSIQWGSTPAAVQVWAVQVSDSALRLTLIFPLVCAALGIALIATSFLGFGSKPAGPAA